MKHVKDMRYKITINPRDAFGSWVNGGEYEDTMGAARKTRTRIARAVGLPSHAVWISDTKTNKDNIV